MERAGSKRALRWYAQEWRNHYRLSQEQVAERMGTTKGQVSKLETGRQQFNDKWILGYAEALGLEPRDLLRHPETPSAADLLKDYPETIELLRAADPADLRRAADILRTLLKRS
jgi:transcriptional regulator with XRE-family HTH domain